jgi:hypothetical protein
MQTIQARYDGKVFVPIYPLNIAKNRLALITVLEEEASKEPAAAAESDTPISDSLLGILKDMPIKNKDDIKRMRLAEYL